MSKVSIIVPSRNEMFLNKTVEDLLKKCTGDIEVIVILDGYWANPMPPQDNRVVYIHNGSPKGLRTAVNSAVAIARGDYILKIDAHCMVDEGFDEKLKAECAPDWVMIPRRKRLDAENWTIQDVGKPDVDYEFLSFPYWKPDEVGIHGTIWTERIVERKDNPKYDIDEDPAFQGSCYFMHKKFFTDVLGDMQNEGYGTFIGEPQEIGLKAWLSGGKVMVNKKTWYAHLHKGKTYGRGYSMDKRELIAGNAYSVDYWMNNRWDKAKRTIEWFINEQFPDMPTWVPNWREICIEKGLIKQ